MRDPQNDQENDQADPTAALAGIRMVLLEPAGPRNLGSVARIMKNMGVQQLWLINPQCSPADPEAKLMAVHATEILDQAQMVSSLPAALAGCERVIGTTGRNQNYPPEWRIEAPRPALAWLLETEAAALVFGPEDRGLSNHELSYCQRHVMIPANPDYPSLNLAQAVAICCYELRLASLETHADQTPPDRTSSVPTEVMEGFYYHLETLLLQISYLQPQTAARKLAKFRALFNRADLTLAEIALLRGILRQLGWAHRHQDPLDR